MGVAFERANGIKLHVHVLINVESQWDTDAEIIAYKGLNISQTEEEVHSENNEVWGIQREQAITVFHS